MPRWGYFISLAALSCSGFSYGQTTISLEEAVKLAKSRNGTLRAATLDVKASESRLSQSFANFMPTLTPLYRYDSSRNEREIGGSTVTTKTNEGTSQLQASWQLLDSGQRDLIYRGSKRSLEQQRATATQTLRQTLFSVHQRYFDALRSQEQLKVQEASVERANEILKLTDAQIAVGAAPRKDRLQANADFLNAQVGKLTAQNQVNNSSASLKATIGWSSADGGIALAAMPEPTISWGDLTLEAAVKDGLAAREDLRARRFGISAQELSAERARRESGITWSLDANYTRQFSETEADNRNLTFLVSYPLFDGNRRREQAREAGLALAATLAEYRQAERDAIAEIESAFLELNQNAERLVAAKAALEAARENYKAAAESQKEGAEGTSVITTLTAKISLVTAESNYVDAVYDMYIADVRFRLATGKTLPYELE